MSNNDYDDDSDSGEGEEEEFGGNSDELDSDDSEDSFETSSYNDDWDY